jgi:hypothetical protein
MIPPGSVISDTPTPAIGLPAKAGVEEKAKAQKLMAMTRMMIPFHGEHSTKEGPPKRPVVDDSALAGGHSWAGLAVADVGPDANRAGKPAPDATAIAANEGHAASPT